MNENNTIKKMVSMILRGLKNASFDRHIMHPEREWFTSVFIGLGLFAIGIGWNVSTHLQFKNVSISSGPVVEETVIYREGLVDSALKDFEVRKRQYEELKQSLLVRQVASPIVAEPVVDEGPATTTEQVAEEPVTEEESEAEATASDDVLLVI
jgi:hypothetical protein